MDALNVQVGGDHYKSCKIQTVEFIEANGLGFLEGCIVERVTRHDKPSGKGRQDIEKAIHELQLLLQLRYGVNYAGFVEPKPNENYAGFVEPKPNENYAGFHEPSEQILRERYGGTD